MNLIQTIMWRAAIMLLVAWAAVGMVTLVVLIKYTFWREDRTTVFVNTECPACEGTGWTPEQEVCGLCDGESTLIHEIDA